MKQFKNIFFLFLFLFISIVIIYINKIEDPYDYQEFVSNGCINNTNKDLIYTFINLSSKKNYDYLYIGSSGGTFSFVPNAFQNYIKKDIAIIQYNALTPNEIYNYTKHFIECNPETKNIIISLEYSIFFDTHHIEIIEKSKYNRLHDFIKMYYSFDATKKSLKKIINKHKTRNKVVEKSQPNENSVEHLFDHLSFSYKHNFAISFNTTALQSNLNEFKKINDLLISKNINVTYFIPPVNALLLYDMYEKGIYPKMEFYKKEIAKISPFYDFSYTNQFTSQKLNYIFCDTYHLYGVFFSKKIYEILSEKEDKNFGIKITQNNVNDILKNQHDDLINYIKNNQTYVRAYTKNSINDHKKVKIKKLIYKDLPKEAKQQIYNNLTIPN